MKKERNRGLCFLMAALLGSIQAAECGTLTAFAESFEYEGVTQFGTMKVYPEMDTAAVKLIVEEVYASAGNYLEEGEKVLKLTSDSYQEALDYYAAAIIRAQNSLTNVQMEYDKALQEAEYTYEIAAAQADQAEFVREQQTRELEETITEHEEVMSELEELIAEYEEGIADGTYSASSASGNTSSGGSSSFGSAKSSQKEEKEEAEESETESEPQSELKVPDMTENQEQSESSDRGENGGQNESGAQGENDGQSESANQGENGGQSESGAQGENDGQSESANQGENGDQSESGDKNEDGTESGNAALDGTQTDELTQKIAEAQAEVNVKETVVTELEKKIQEKNRAYNGILKELYQAAGLDVADFCGVWVVSEESEAGGASLTQNTAVRTMSAYAAAVSLPQETLPAMNSECSHDADIQVQEETENRTAIQAEADSERVLYSEVQLQSEIRVQAEAAAQSQAESPGETKVQTEGSSETKVQAESSSETVVQTESQSEILIQKETAAPVQAENQGETEVQAGTSAQNQSEMQGQTETAAQTEIQEESQRVTAGQTEVQKENRGETEGQTEVAAQSQEENRKETEVQSQTSPGQDTAAQPLKETSEEAAGEIQEKVSETEESESEKTTDALLAELASMEKERTELYQQLERAETERTDAQTKLEQLKNAQAESEEQPESGNPGESEQEPEGKVPGESEQEPENTVPGANGQMGESGNQSGISGGFQMPSGNGSFQGMSGGSQAAGNAISGLSGTGSAAVSSGAFDGSAFGAAMQIGMNEKMQSDDSDISLFGDAYDLTEVKNLMEQEPSSGEQAEELLEQLQQWQKTVTEQYAELIREEEATRLEIQYTYDTALIAGKQAEITYQEETESQKKTLQEAEDKLEELQKEKTLLETFNDGIITASQAGYTAAVNYEAEDILRDSIALYSVYEMDTATVALEVPQEEIALFDVGNTVDVQISGSRSRQGTVAAKAADSTGEGSRTDVNYEVEVSIDNANGRLSAQSAAVITIEGESEETSGDE